MTGSDTAGPRVGKTIREKTSLLPRSCLVCCHLAAVGVSSDTDRPPATGNGSVVPSPSASGCRWESAAGYPRGRSLGGLLGNTPGTAGGASTPPESTGGSGSHGNWYTGGYRYEAGGALPEPA